MTIRFAVKLAAVLSALALQWAGPAQAGAWPRGTGNVFLSSSAMLTWPDGRDLEFPDVYGAFYAEYGVRDNLTLGLDVGSADMDKMERTHIIALARYSLAQPGATHQFAVDLGAGMDLGEAALRIGASYGRGLSVGDLNGWLSLEWATQHSPYFAAQTHKLDATLGLSLNRIKIITQLSLHRSYQGRQSATFTPSIVRAIGKGRHVELGGTFGLGSKRDPALKIGLWQEF